MSFTWNASAADRRLLPEGRLAGPMPWVIAIMMFLTALAAASGLALGAAARDLRAGLDRAVTIEIVEADAGAREAKAAAASAAAMRVIGVSMVHRVGQAEIRALLAPWLGTAGATDDLPLPALIDVEFDAAANRAALTTAITRAAPGARIDDHQGLLAPLARLIASLRWFALALVLLMTGATAAAVVLAARAALDTHRETIDVLHMMGGTDIQIARLFQRRIALDALFGGLIGLAGAVAVIMLLGQRVAAVGSDLLGAVRLPGWAWLLLLLLPIAGTLLAALTARLTVVAALRRIL